MKLVIELSFKMAPVFELLLLRDLFGKVIVLVFKIEDERYQQEYLLP